MSGVLGGVTGTLKTFPTFVFRFSEPSVSMQPSGNLEIDSLGNTFMIVEGTNSSLVKINPDGSLNKAVAIINNNFDNFDISPYDNSIWDTAGATTIVRYDNNLTEAKSYTFTVSGTVLTLSDIDFYPNGDFVVSGRYTTTGNQIRAVVARVTAAGTVSWAREYSISGNSLRIQSFYSCVVNPATEDVFLLGLVGTSADSTTLQTIMARYTSNGTLGAANRYARISTSSRLAAKFSNFWLNDKAHFSTKDFSTGNNNISVITDGGTAVSFTYRDVAATSLLQLGNNYANIQKGNTGSTGQVEIGVFNNSFTRIVTHGITNFQDTGDLNIREIAGSDKALRVGYAEQNQVINPNTIDGFVVAPAVPFPAIGRTATVAGRTYTAASLSSPLFNINEVPVAGPGGSPVTANTTMSVSVSTSTPSAVTNFTYQYGVFN